MLRFIFAVAIAALAPAAAWAHDYQLGQLYVDHPYAIATPPGAPVGAAYFSIENTGPSTEHLLSLTSPVAGMVQVHEMKMDGDVMRMREVKSLAIPAGRTVALKPGVLHIMLMQLKQPLKAGDKFPMTLTFDHAGKLDVSVPVEPPRSGD